MTHPAPDPLREAAQAVLDCWDSRNWKAAPTADYMRRLRVALARLSAPETLAWAVVGEDGSLIGINYDRETAQHLCNPGESVVRVAIRVVEAGA